ncbi:MAG: DUF4214 domain-containing protein [Actinomycetota bacterium]
MFAFALVFFAADVSLLPAEAETPGGADGLLELIEYRPDPGTGGGTAPTDLTEVPAPIVVETAGFVTTPDGGTGGHDAPPDVQDAMEEHAAEIRADAAARADEQGVLPQATWAAANGGLSVSYNASYPSPLSVQNVVNTAVAQWDSVLATNPSGPVVIEVFWSNLGNPGLLGYAGPDGMFYGGGLPTSSLYPAALTNTLLGIDANGSSRAEVQVVLNAELLANNRWYLGTTGTPPGNQIDLLSVALHEIGHGLGFLGSGTVPNGQTEPSLNSPTYVYDEVASHAGAPITSVGDQGAALKSGDVHIQISTGLSYELYAPSSWSQGSSFSHFDESQYPPGSPGSLMTPMLASGETARILDGPTLGVMARTGWPVTVAALTPTVTNISASLTMAIVSWNHQLGTIGVAPDQYRLEAWRDGTTLQSTAVISGGESTGTVGSLTPGQAYTVRVVPIGPNGDGTAAAATISLPSAGGPADPADWPTYIRDVPLDGQINRLYQAYFLRLPDLSGWTYWLDQRASPVPLAAVSDAFAASTEFQTMYGSLTDEAFIDLVYANVLNRSADSAGRDYWLAQLAAGVPRGTVMMSFAESGEYVDRTQTAAPTDVDEARISRLYQAFFLRAPDADGLAYWTGQAKAGVTLEAIAAAFAGSDEFVTEYGALTDTQFVTLVYANVLDRAPDQAGLDHWVGLLAAGLDRGTVMVGFSESSEFIKSTGTIP